MNTGRVTLASTNPNLSKTAITQSTGTSYKEQYAIAQAPPPPPPPAPSLGRPSSVADMPAMTAKPGTYGYGSAAPAPSAPIPQAPPQYATPPQVFAPPSASNMPAMTAPGPGVAYPQQPAPQAYPDMPSPGPQGGGGGGAPGPMPALGPMPSYDDYDDGYYSNAPPMASKQASQAIQPVVSTPGAPTVAKKSLWERFLAFLGLAKASKPSFGGDSLEDDIASLIIRARAGDQNATAMICTIRDNAERGDKKAQRSLKVMDAYFKKHPVFGYDQIIHQSSHGPVPVTFSYEPSFGEEEPCYAFGCQMAGEPVIPNSKIREFLAQFGDEGRKAFAYGFLNAERIGPSDPYYHDEMVRTGKAIGIARRLQANRYHNNYNPQVGWELGE